MKQPFRFCAISTGFVVLTFMLCSATIQTAQAQTCSTSTIDMKLLVVTNGRTEADFPAIKQILDYLGTPYDVLDMTANTGGITASMLFDGSCHGYYQGVIFAYGGYIYTLPGMSILTAYEQKFAIRQVNWYMYPNNDFGFNYPYNGVITSAGTASASFTSAGASTFWYANTVTPLTISNAYTYLGTPLSALPSGASVTPLLTDASGNALVLIYALGDGRQYLTQTFDSSPYLMHDLILAYGLGEILPPIAKGVDQHQGIAGGVREQGRYRSPRRQRTERCAQIGVSIRDGKRCDSICIPESRCPRAGKAGAGGASRSNNAVIGIVESAIGEDHALVVTVAIAIGQHRGSNSSGVGGHIQNVVGRAQIVEDLLNRWEIGLCSSIRDHQQLHVDRRRRASLGLRGLYCGRTEHEREDHESGGNSTKVERLLHHNTSVDSETVLDPKRRLAKLYVQGPTAKFS